MSNASQRPLPHGWRWARLGEVCAINPRRPDLKRPDDTLTTFVPMSAVEEDGRGITRAEQRPFSEVKKGYTYFGEGDVLFAKITPCMQNGKHATAQKLTDGVGFGSTEFHVLRPESEIISEWVHHFILQPWVLEEATAHFTGAVGQQRVPENYLAGLSVPLPSLPEQRRIAAILSEQMAAVEQARAAAEDRLIAAMALPSSFMRESLATARNRRYLLSDCLTEVRNGVGASWSAYPVLGATRVGIAPAKDGVGKAPERYKLVDPVTVFYNPMRILLGSIALVDEGDTSGITSPDYVVVKGRPGVLDTRWFYHWFRSVHGARLIDSLSRGAVRERVLFNRLSAGEIDLPDHDTQRRTSKQMRQVRVVVEAIKQELATINKLPATLLRRAFEGGL
jgi:type I restriction enzyme S subunit